MRRVRRILLWLGGVTVFLAAFGYWQWQLMLERLQVNELQVDIGSLGFSHLQLNSLQLRLTQPERVVALRLKAADFRWRWQGFTPVLSWVSVADALVQIEPLVSATAEPAAPWVLPANWALPDYLPQELNIDHLVLALPCASGRCEISARVHSLRGADSLKLQVTMRQTPTAARVGVSYQLRGGLPQLEVEARAQAFFELQGKTGLHQADGLQWQGDLNARANRPESAWLTYLQAWNPRLDASWLDAFTQPVSAAGHWQLALAPLLAHSLAQDQAQGLAQDQMPDQVQDPAADQLPVVKPSLAELLHRVGGHLDGELALTLDLPSPVPILNLGDLSGKADVDIAIAAGVLTRYDLDIDGVLANPILPGPLTDYDLMWDSVALKLDSSVVEGVDLQALPMQVQVTTEGNLALKLDATVQLDADQFAVSVSDAKLAATADSWSPLADFTLKQFSLQQGFSAQWSYVPEAQQTAAEQTGSQPGSLVTATQAATRPQVSYTSATPTNITFDLTAPGLEISGARLNLEQLQVSGNPLDWRTGQLHLVGALQIAELRQAHLNPQAWSWRGQITAADQQLRGDGLLIAAGQLNLEHQWVLTPTQAAIDWQLGNVFLLAGKGLQQLTPYWPPLLTLSRGRVSASGRLVWPLSDAPLAGTMTWQLGDLAGIYDTTAFKGASGTLAITHTGQELTLASDNLAAAEILQGFTLGPARAAASYKTTMDRFTHGQLKLTQLESDLLGGRIWIAPGQLDFAQDRQTLLLELADIDLARLLAEHPAGDLVGSGRISGHIPLELSEAGVEVTQGKLSAAEPGGRLQYRSERAAALAASSPGMKLVTDALDDFHYTVLRSDLSYSDTGTLLLGLRLEGRSPAVEAGRPIHFNINLEEDLPALLYSLQLSNQISDVIKRRVQEKMQSSASPRQ